MAGRTWLAVALACLVWFVYMKWFVPPPPAPGQLSPPTSAQSRPEADRAKLPSPLEAGFSRGELIDLNNSSLELAVSSDGGKVRRARVREYRETLDEGSDFISVLDPERSESALSTLFTHESLRELGTASYEGSKAEGTVTYRTRAANGIEMVKQYRLEESGHFVDASFELRFPEGSPRSGWGDMLLPVGGSGYQYDYGQPMQAWEVVAYQDGSVSRKSWEDLKGLEGGEEVSRGKTDWLAFGNRYFATAVVNQSELNPDVVFVGTSQFTGAYLRFPLVRKEGQDSVKFSFRLFLGPKDVDELSQVPGLRELVDYGMFAFLAYPLLWLLRFFYGMFHNYGIAIILLTILVRVVFYPLSLKSYRSMKEMQKLQPQLKALREKYKDDMQRFNQEQMALFRAHKVNPMGGCLPMLVQLPVFFALYTVLSNSIELFHAPFFGWIQDLSDKDPLYIVPILMGLSMVVQQKMTPTAGMDPMQAKIMMLMPVIFTFVMLNLPSGLTVYIFLSTLLGILQQWAINRESSVPQVAVAQNQGTGK